MKAITSSLRNHLWQNISWHIVYLQKTFNQISAAVPILKRLLQCYDFTAKSEYLREATASIMTSLLCPFISFWLPYRCTGFLSDLESDIYICIMEKNMSPADVKWPTSKSNRVYGKYILPHCFHIANTCLKITNIVMAWNKWEGMSCKCKNTVINNSWFHTFTGNDNRLKIIYFIKNICVNFVAISLPLCINSIHFYIVLYELNVLFNFLLLFSLPVYHGLVHKCVLCIKACYC